MRNELKISTVGLFGTPSSDSLEQSTPIVHDATTDFPTNFLILEGDGWSARQARLAIRETLGEGAQGEVFNAVLIFTDTSGVEAEYPCVVKHLFTSSDPHTPREFLVQKELTDGHPSANTGLLKIMGIHTVMDDAGRIHKYAIMPKCDAILSRSLPKIRALEKSAYYAEITNFFRSMCHGLENLFKHQIAHLDLKLENIGLYKGSWRMIDYGLAQHYDEYINKKIARRKRGELEGTPHCIPPERLEGECNFPFARDVWAVGQMLQQLLKDRCHYQYDESGVELGRDAHLRIKGRAYLDARIEFAKKESTFDDAAHQAELQHGISAQDNFVNCLNYIADAMCNIFPERRPHLATLQKACEKLESLLPTITVKRDAPQTESAQIKPEQKEMSHARGCGFYSPKRKSNSTSSARECGRKTTQSL